MLCSYLQIQQKGTTKVHSSVQPQNGKACTHYDIHMQCFITEKWDNSFTAMMLVTNAGDGNLIITSIEGYYCTSSE